MSLESSRLHYHFLPHCPINQIFEIKIFLFPFCRPLVGKALTTPGQIGLGIVLALSAYFIYINYITNPEFYKSLQISREAGTRGSHEQPAE